jgi:DNA-binding NtrC family response regulator
MKVVDTALVIDDDFLMRGYVVESLQREGVVVMEADSVEDARRMQDYHHFDLVFCDLKQVGSNGLELKSSSLKPVRESLQIIMTSFASVEKAVEVVQAGAYDYLIKPFSPEQVALVVSRARELLKLRAQSAVLQENVQQPTITVGGPVLEPAPATPEPSAASMPEITNLHELERQTILHVMQETDGNRSVMADKLGISVRTLRNKLNQYRDEEALSGT